MCIGLDNELFGSAAERITTGWCLTTPFLREEESIDSIEWSIRLLSLGSGSASFLIIWGVGCGGPRSV